MKKLIALAVAAASVPAMAAVTVSGSTNVEYVSAKASGVSTKSVQTYENDINVGATSELNNGMTISASVKFRNSGSATATGAAASNDGAGSLTIASAYGKLSVGDVAGALDAVDGLVAAPARDDMSGGIGDDHAVSYTAPTFVEGLQLMASWSPKGGSGQTSGADIDADGSAISVKYSTAGFSAFYGQEENAGSAADETGYGVSYTVGGLKAGVNFSEVDAGDESTAVVVAYTMGDLTVAYNTATTDNNAGVEQSDATTVGLAYVLGGGATAYVTRKDVDTASGAASTDSTTRAGIKFSF